MEKVDAHLVRTRMVARYWWPRSLSLCGMAASSAVYSLMKLLIREKISSIRHSQNATGRAPAELIWAFDFVVLMIWMQDSLSGCTGWTDTGAENITSHRLREYCSEKIAFSGLLQARQHNFFTSYLRNQWEVIFSAPVDIQSNIYPPISIYSVHALEFTQLTHSIVSTVPSINSEHTPQIKCNYVDLMIRNQS